MVTAIQSVKMFDIVDIPRSMAMPSLPQLGHRESSEGRVTELRYPVFSLMFVRFHTLTYLSHLPETMMGLAVSGENLTQETQ